VEKVNLFLMFLFWDWGLNLGPTPWAIPPVLTLWWVFLR
jgi:hypothetical protein